MLMFIHVLSGKRGRDRTPSPVLGPSTLTQHRLAQQQQQEQARAAKQARREARRLQQQQQQRQRERVRTSGHGEVHVAGMKMSTLDVVCVVYALFWRVRLHVPGLSYDIGCHVVTRSHVRVVCLACPGLIATHRFSL